MSDEPLPQDPVVQEEDKKPKKKKKSVGFAPAPVEELHEHHQKLKQIHDEKAKSNPFHKIPPELAYLDKSKKDAPRPLLTYAEIMRRLKQKQNEPIPSTELTTPDTKPVENFRYVPVKELSTQNNETAINFHYSEFKLPVPANKLVVNIKYANLNSFDLSKINKFGLNVSEEKIGLGCEFAGEVLRVGTSLSNKFNRGDKVLGIINPASRKGSLASSQIIDPSSDVVLVLDDEALQKLDNVDIEIKRDGEDFVVGEEESTEQTSDSPTPTADAQTTKPKSKQTYVFPVEDSLPVLAKASSIPLYYCRAKQMLDHLDKRAKLLKILINGADTITGLTLIQLLTSRVYEDLEEIDIIGVIRESSSVFMESFCRKIDNVSRKIHLVTFDSLNEDLVLPGEAIPINYKKPELFALQVLEKIFFYEESIDAKNVNGCKLDCIIDLVGSKKYFQRLINYKRLDELDVQWTQEKLLVPFRQLFRSNEDFLMNILKPKSQGSSFVLGCRFEIREPSYEVDKLLNYGWGKSIWGTMPSLANGFSKYNYYEEMELRIRSAWVSEGLRLACEGEIKFEITQYDDWRNPFLPMINKLRQDSRKYVLKIEDF